jgi:zinc transporter ZupT
MLLLAGLAALLVGPLLYQLLRPGSRPMSFVDGFTFITIIGLFVFAILPTAIGAAGWPAWVFAALGLLFPLGVERVFHRAMGRAHLAIVLLAVAGLGLHAVIDGLVLLGGEEGGHGHAHGHAHGSGDAAGFDLALAVILHNIPKGLAVWYLMRPAFGLARSAAVFALLLGGTAGGYLAGDHLLHALDAPALAWFQAFVAGSILHVVLHGAGYHEHGAGRAHSHDAGEVHLHAPPRVERWPERLGLVSGMVLLYFYL